MNSLSQMINDIVVIFRIAFRQTGLDDTQRLRNTLISIIVPLAALYICQLMLSELNGITGWDLSWITMVLSMAATFFIFRALFNLRRLLSLGFIGEGLEALGLSPAEYPTSRLFRAYWNLVKTIFFWELVIIFFLPYFDLTQNPLVGWSLLVGSIAYLIVYPDGKFFQKFSAWAIVAILILMVTQVIISPAAWIKLIGVDPFGAMRTSGTDRVLAETLSDQKEAEDAKTVIRLKEIKKKIKQRKELSPDDKKFIEERKKGLVQETFGKIFSSSADAKSSPKKKEMKQYTIIRPLEFLGGEKIIHGSGCVGVRKGGKAEFRATNLPIVKDGKYKVIFHATRKTTGRDYLLVNAGKGHGGPFYYDNHPASDSPIEITFFKEGMPGDSKYFYPTDNFIQLSADDDLLVQLDNPPYVEITYWQ
ncbi:MAG: hypothetical protein WC643_00600 [Parcubacteria group bacterium]|jgi:hypothetical protein